MLTITLDTSSTPINQSKYNLCLYLMVSRIVLSFQHNPDDQNIFQSRHKSRSCSRTETRLQAKSSITPTSFESLPQSPTKKAQKVLEIRKISYHNTRPKVPRSIDTRSHNSLSSKPPCSHESMRNGSISPRKNKINFQGPLLSTSTISFEFDSNPDTDARTFYNDRLRWTKRNAGDLPLCIINVNGVIGDCFKSCIWANEERKFCFVEGITPGFKFLSSEFYVVLVSWSSREHTKQLIGLIDEGVLHADAVYIVRHRRRKHRFRHNYSQIYRDFAVVEVARQVLVISAVLCSRESIDERKGADIFYEATASGSNRYCVVGMPVTCQQCPKAPFTVLVPHCRLSEDKISFFELAKFVHQIKNKCQGNFENADGEGVCLPCEHQEIPVIPLHPKVFEGDLRNFGKYALFMLCRARRKKPPITRKYSRIKST